MRHLVANLCTELIFFWPIDNYRKKSVNEGSGIDLAYVNLEHYNPRKDTQRRPIKPGVFKGIYGGHGIEIIGINYPSDKILQGYR